MSARDERLSRMLALIAKAAQNPHAAVRITEGRTFIDGPFVYSVEVITPDYVFVDPDAAGYHQQPPRWLTDELWDRLTAEVPGVPTVQATPDEGLFE